MTYEDGKKTRSLQESRSGLLITAGLLAVLSGGCAATSTPGTSEAGTAAKKAPTAAEQRVDMSEVLERTADTVPARQAGQHEPVAGASPAGDVVYRTDGVLTPGGYAVIAAPPGSIVRYGKRAVRVDSLGEVIIGFPRDAGDSVTLLVKLPTGTTRKLMLPLAPRDYDIQRINGLKKKHVTPDPATLRRIRADAAKAKAAREHYLRSVRGWRERPFIWPVSGIVSGIYGSQRILNGKPRRPHYGVDIAAPRGTPVYAPASGRITLNENMVLSGKTMMIDHGYGLRSTFMHLDKVFVREGEVVRKGQKIGEVGSTGRATGPHLHWGMSWYTIRLDPSLFVLQQPTLRKGLRVRARSTATVAGR